MASTHNVLKSSTDNESTILFDPTGKILSATSHAKAIFSLEELPNGQLRFPDELSQKNVQFFKSARSKVNPEVSASLQLFSDDESGQPITGRLYQINVKGSQVYQAILNDGIQLQDVPKIFPELIKKINIGNSDIKATGDEVLNYLIHYLGAAGSLVHIADFKKKYLYLSNSIGISFKAIRKITRLKFSEGITGEIFNKEEVVFFPDVQKEPWVTKKLSLEILTEFNVRSYIGIPLIVDESCIGVIGIVFTHQIPPPGKFQRELLLSIAGNLATHIYKGQVEARGNKFFHQLSILRELTPLWRQSDSFQELFIKTANLVVERLQFWDLSFFQYLPDRGTLLKIAAVGGMSDYIPDDYEQPISEGIIGWVVRNGKSKYVPDVRKEKIFVPVPGGETLSELAIPIKIGEKIFGVINLESRGLDAYDDIDIWTMETVGQYLALYLEHVQNSDRQIKQVENLQIINEISQTLNSIIDQYELQKKICDFLSETFDLHYISIFIYDHAEGLLRKVYSARGTKTQKSLNSTVTFQDGILAWVARNKKPYYADDVSIDSLYIKAKADDTGSEYCFPILFGDELYGVLNIESNKTNIFNSHQLITIQTIIEHFSRALRNAVLFTQINREKEKTEAILSQMQEGVVIADSDDKIIYFNDKAAVWFPEVKSDRNPLPFYQSVKERLVNTRTQYSFEYEDNRNYWRVNAIRMKENTRKDHLLIVFEDVTESKKSEAQKIEHSRMEMAVKMAGSIAHELNQPLTGILGYCSLLMEDLEPDSDLYNDIKTIEEQANRISNLVRRFQTLVRIKTKPYLGETEIIDIEKSGS